MPPFISTSAIILDSDRLLVVHDPIRGEPILPGGHLRWRETPLAALAREVFEETGYQVQTGSLVGVFAGEAWSGEPGIVRVVYEAEIVGGDLRSSAEGEALWMPLHDMLDRPS